MHPDEDGNSRAWSAAEDSSHTNHDYSLNLQSYHLNESTGTRQKDKWKPLFGDDLSNAIKPNNVWSVENGVITANQDQAIWTEEIYSDVNLL